MSKEKIVFTGGGTSGHVTPNIALIKELQKLNWECSYIGSQSGVEKELMLRCQIPYYSISSGKLRRYFSWQNFIDPFKICIGIFQAYIRLRKIKPKIIFSKGGFVSFPVVFAAWLNKIPTVIHESDLYPGLANKLSFPFSKKICVTFAETANHIKYKNKIIVTGTPIRSEFFSGNKERARNYLELKDNYLNLLIIGGSSGAEIINKNIRDCLIELTEKYNVIHICGKGKIDKKYSSLKRYKQFEYLHEELFDIMALADLVISRAGANSLYELLVLKKPHLLIPLSKKSSRGDQIDNATYFHKIGSSLVIREEELNKETLLSQLKFLEDNLLQFKINLDKYNCPIGTKNILDILIRDEYVITTGSNDV